jgi:hypothetical protein
MDAVCSLPFSCLKYFQVRNMMIACRVLSMGWPSKVQWKLGLEQCKLSSSLISSSPSPDSPWLGLPAHLSIALSLDKGGKEFLPPFHIPIICLGCVFGVQVLFGLFCCKLLQLWEVRFWLGGGLVAACLGCTSGFGCPRSGLAFPCAPHCLK